MRQNKLRKIVVAVTLAAAGVAFSASASAAGLGRLTVLSSLGQPLRAEIDLAAITREEAASLAARLASPDAFRQAGVDYNTALLGIRFSVQRRAGGQYYVSMVSSQPINEPFLDLLVELNWATGRLVREYTFLLDPADMKPVAPPSVAPAPVIRAEAPRAAEPAPTPAPVAAPVAARPAEPAMVVKPTPKPASKPVATPKPASSASPAGGTYEVRKGDTLGKIARQSAQEGVSLDQMLIALLRANPDAFVGGNVNRLKSGVILNLPDKNAASGVAQSDARRLVVAQATDFKAYQDKLAGVVQAAPAAKAEAPRQQARGTITAKVDDKAQKGDAKDQLKLSKADPAGLKDGAKGKPRASEEDRVSKERALKESNVRVAELEKNVKDLQKLGEVKSAALADAQKQAQAQAKPPAQPMAQGADAKKGAEPAKAEPAKVEPPKPVPPPAAVVAKVEPPKAEPPKVEPPKVEPPKAEPPKAEPPKAESAKPLEPPKAAEPPKAPEPPKIADLPKMGEAPKSADGPKADTPAKPADPVVIADAAKAGDAAKAADAPKAADPPKVAANKPMAAPPPEPSLMDEFLDNPAYLAGGGGVLALLGGYAAYAVRRKRKVDKFENSIITGGDLKANSVFGNTGGQSVDTGNSSFQSDFSQVGAGSMDADEVDPVAEADVYMAYGRDAQAEEILKEALQKDPTRHSVRIKLMEIYSQRSDTAAFEAHARELHTATTGHGEHWERAVVLGQALLPGNPLFGSAATAPDPMTSTVTLAPGAFAAAAAAAAATPPESMESTMQMQAFNPALQVAPPAPDPMSRTHSLAAPSELDSRGGLTVDFDLGGSAEPQVAVGSMPDFILDAPAAKSSSDNTLDFDIGGGMPAAAAPTDFSPGGTLILEAPAFGSDDIANMETQPLPDMRPPEAPHPTIDFDFDLGADAPATTTSATVAPAGNTMDFDLSAIDLDLPGKDAPSSAAAAPDDAATKLDLAKAYRDMGDKDGAKELLQEVLNEGSVAQQAEAKGLMATLG